MSTDPYAALGVSKTASDAEIKKAYRRIARECHPDLKPDDAEAEARFKAASAAYDLLKDPEQRARFDRGEIDASGQEQAPRSYYREHAQAGDNPYRQGGPYGGGFESEGFDASDIFEQMFRQQRAQQGRARRDPFEGYAMKGADRRYTLSIDFLEAVNGGATQISLPEGGALEVKIPRGIADGQTLRLRGKGAPGLGEGPPGDALITLDVRPHPVFTREGDDILTTLDISLDEAVLGAKVEAPTIEGPVRVTIPRGTSSGQTLRLKGRGVAGKGDQRIELRIVMPDEVDAELAQFMDGWRKTHGYNPRDGRA